MLVRGTVSPYQEESVLLYAKVWTRYLKLAIACEIDPFYLVYVLSSISSGELGEIT